MPNLILEDTATEVEIAALTIAGWTGRDAAAVQHHIDELAAIGIAPPSTTPLFYRVSETLLTTAEQVTVLGPDSSGEAEPMVLKHNGETWLGLGSDHTDRKLEATSVAASKQACAKPCATQLWRLSDVADHLDRIEIKSWIEEGGTWVTYQSGTLSQLLPLQNLIAAHGLGENAAILCGTFPAIGGVRPAAKFRATMRDPIRAREISMSYEARILPVVA